MVKVVIFDCFGVIITDALEMLRTDLVQTQPDKAARIEDIINASNRGFLEPKDAILQLAELSGRSYDEVRQAINQAEAKDTRLMEYIKQLRVRGYKTGLLSNISSQGLKDRFTTEELTEYFDAAVASGDIGYAKPEPEAFEIIAERLSARLDECVMVDDRQVCIDGARAVGMQGVLYTGFEAGRTLIEAELQ